MQDGQPLDLRWPCHAFCLTLWDWGDHGMVASHSRAFPLLLRLTLHLLLHLLDTLLLSDSHLLIIFPSSSPHHPFLLLISLPSFSLLLIIILPSFSHLLTSSSPSPLPSLQNLLLLLLLLLLLPSSSPLTHLLFIHLFPPHSQPLNLLSHPTPPTLLLQNLLLLL